MVSLGISFVYLETVLENPWEGDRLRYEQIGQTFTNLIKTLDTSKVLSIEAGFGRGKTFFRRAWAEHLRRTGEVVVELDVQQSDHSGDPIITLLGALVEILPRSDKDTGKKVLESAQKLGAIGLRAATRALLKSGADELIDAATEKSIDALADFDALDGLIEEFGEGISKAAGQLIASQMAAEKVRKTELPEQLATLQAALTENAENKRVVVIVDELDRCHPDYAIAFLEAMKLVFSQSGFVFCLMVNAEYLERLAQHRFGASTNDEKYLDKFVDIRLRLAPPEEAFKTAVYDLASELPLAIPFGETEDFSVEHAAKLASELALDTQLSMRKIKRLILKVEIALRCYAAQPLDLSLLIYLAFKSAAPEWVSTTSLPRSMLTPEEGAAHLRDYEQVNANTHHVVERMNKLIFDSCRELQHLPRDRFRLPDDKSYYEWALVFKFLAPHYIPFHQNVLDSVAEVMSEN